MNIFIVGGEKLAYFLSRTFVSKGHRVTVVNRDRRKCERLARQLSATVVWGDGSDVRTLEEAEAEAADAVLAVTPNDQDNLVICQLASSRFRVPHVLALVNDPDHEEVFRRLDIKATLSVTALIATLIEQRAGFDEVVNLLPAGEGKLNIAEIVLKEDSPVAGRTLREAALPEDCLVAGITRRAEPIIPRGPTVLEPGDHLVLVTLPASYGPALRALVGEEE